MLRRDAQAGLTLIEVLVVLVVIGIATGAAMTGLNRSDRSVRAENEAVRLSRHLSLAVDEALLSGLPLQLVWDDGGYAFQQWQQAEAKADTDATAGWGPATIPGLAARHDLRPPLRMAVTDGTDAPVLIAASVTGPARQVTFDGAGVPWAVNFDGFAALAAPLGPS